MANQTPKVMGAREMAVILKFKPELIADTKKLLAKLKDEGFIWNKDKADWVKSSGEITIMITAGDDHIDALAEKVIQSLIDEYEYGNLSLSNPEYRPTQAKDRAGIDREGFSYVYLNFQNTDD